MEVNISIFGNVYKYIKVNCACLVAYISISKIVVGRFPRKEKKIDGFAAILTDDALNLWLTFLLLNYGTIYSILQHTYINAFLCIRIQIYNLNCL